MRERSVNIKQSLDSILSEIISLNQDIEETKKKLIEIQFNATIASFMFNK